jgi:hypothetical protein
MRAYEMLVCLSDEAVQELDRPGSRFRDYHSGTVAEGLSSEVAALLQSLGVPSEGIRVESCLRLARSEATAPEAVS